MSAIRRVSSANELRHGHPPAETCRAAVDRYFRGCDRHDGELLRSTFHPTAALRTVDRGGAAQRLTQIEWWAIVEASTTCATRRRQRDIEHTDQLALVETEALWTTHQVNDLLLVAKDWIGWTIVGCVSYRGPAGARARIEADEVTAIRALLHEAYAPTALYDRRGLLARYASDCRFVYTRPHELGFETLSEVAARRALLADGPQPRPAPTSIETHVVVRDVIAAARVSYLVDQRPCVEMLLLLKTDGAWRIVDVASNDKL